MKPYLLCVIMMGGMVSMTAGKSAVSIIPKPVSLQQTEGFFEITAQTVIVADKDVQDLAQQFRQILSPALGFSLTIAEDTSVSSRYIHLKRRADLTSFGAEGYQIMATEDKVLIEAPEKNGLFYGLQTLRQLLPAEVFGQTAANNVQWRIPCVKIQDYPRFQWRGMHLDVCRHFMPKEFVKKYIDLLAMHKMNSFHWHLTDDQGWRIEIKKYPKLTEIGAWRKETIVGRNSGQFDGIRHGGFYSQQDIREIVDYAKKRYINIVPEIEMPGHSQAALAAYPELGNTGEKLEVFTQWGVNPNVFNADDGTIQFLQDVLTEVMELFPSEFIHIGGDECPKVQWKESPKAQAKIKQLGLRNEDELQSWFIRQMDTFLAGKGRRLIGWDEILEGGLAPGATVMSWRGIEGGIAAAKAGHDVVMAPNGYTYFDYYQAEPAGEPLAIGGFVPIEKVYSYDPVPQVLSTERQKHILGVQAQIWTEYISSPQYAEYMAYPRACALAEVGWTPLSGKDYEDFYQRLTIHTKRLKVLNVNYRPLDPPRTIAGHWKSGQTTETFNPMELEITPLLKESGTYSVIFQYTGGAHRLDIQSVELLADDKVVAKDQHLGITGVMTKDNIYSLNLRQYDPSTHYVLRAVVRSDGGTDSNGQVYLIKE